MWHHAMKVLLMYICLTVVTANEELCDGEGYIYSKVLDRCYKKHGKGVNWFRAVKQCRSESASLLVLETMKEVNYINNLDQFSGFMFNFGHGFVGVHDMFKEGVFVTIHGDFLDTLEFSTFFDKEEKTKSEQGNCLYFAYQSTFRRYKCNSTLPFICEKAAKKQDDKHRSLTLQVPKDGFCSPIVVIP